MLGERGTHDPSPTGDPVVALPWPQSLPLTAASTSTAPCRVSGLCTHSVLSWDQRIRLGLGTRGQR
mgnify:CR=1 FL=1